MNKKLYVSPAPHVTSSISSVTMMIAMIIALTPTAVMGCINFGIRALYIIIISVASSFDLQPKRKFSGMTILV